ncbi:MAG TPA: hypothetical protein VOA41_10230 [Candidatus Dormibacteraeota bacterium]|nr:hypothetical protein [Candidatus Dormibacteraeota bacterium]
MNNQSVVSTTKAIDAFSITKEVIKFEKRDVRVDRLSIPNPKPKPMNKEGLSENYFMFQEDGRTVLLESSARSPYALSRVDHTTVKGAEVWNYLCNLGGEVASLLKGGCL